VEYSELFKALLGVFSAISAIAIYKFNMAKSLQVRADLIEKLEEALERKNKHSVCELFRLLHGSRLNYKEIIVITSNDDVSRILYALKKTPGMVTFKNGELKFTTLFKRPWVRSVNKYVSRGFAYLFGALTIVLIIVMAMTDGAVSIAMLIFVIPCFAVLTMQINDLKYDQMVYELVGNNET